MRVLVTWGSERGGTEEIARILAESLRRDDIRVEAIAADEVDTLDGFDAVIVGGALYANRWHHAARRFVRRHRARLCRVPVWFFSSGPLDESADRGDIAPTTQAAALMAWVGARGHVTFGGRLTPDARGFPARAMAKKLSGDWRNPARVRAWADELAAMLPTARPGLAVEPRGRALPRLVGHAVLGAVLAVAARLGLFALFATGPALALHALVTTAVFVWLAGLYFRPRGAREPLPTAFTFAASVAVLDVSVLAVLQPAAAVPVALAAVTLEAVIALLAVSLTGVLVSTLPWPKPPTSPRAV